MNDLYDRVNKPVQKSKRRRDPWVVFLLVVAIIVLIGVIVAIYYWFYLDDLYYDFVADLSESTVTMNKAKIIPIEIDGDDSCILKTSTAYGLYNKLTCWKQFRLSDEEPQGEGIHVQYPDGSSLSIWYTDIDVSTWSRDHGVLVSYVNQDGDEFRYITDRLVYADLVYYLKNN